MTTMDKELIERLAREAGVIAPNRIVSSEEAAYVVPRSAIGRLAALIAEECAKMVTEMDAYTGGHGEPPRPSARQVAAAIRAKFVP